MSGTSRVWIIRRVFLLSCCGLLAVGLALAAVAQGQGGGQQKTTVCHNGKTITNGNPGAPPHLKHPGSYAGPCTPVVTPPPGVIPGTPGSPGVAPGGTGSFTELELTGFDPLRVGCHRGFAAGGLAPPELGNLINVNWIGGEPIHIETPGGENFCMAGGGVQVPVLTKIDARDSKVEIITEGSVRKSSFWDGLFQVLQGDEPHAVTVLKLIGPLERCENATSEKPGGRQLWGEGDGLHRTDGRLGSASVRGTKWLLQDRCNGTTFAKVLEGLVTLHDRVKNETVELEAGDSYTVRP